MAAEKSGWQRRFDSAGSWLDWAGRIWPLLAAFFAGGGVMAYLAAITDWLNKFGPIAWGLAFLLGGTACLGVYFLVLLLARVRMGNKYAQIGLQNTGANRLNKRFEREQIRLADFFHPFYIPYRNVEFHSCSVVGPALIALDGCTIMGTTFKQVQIVIAKSHISITGGIMFRDCRFTDGELCNATLLMNMQTYKQMAAANPDLAQNVPVISDTAIT